VKDTTPSATATVVARNVALVAATPTLSFLVPPEAARLTGLLLQESSRGGAAFVRRARSPWFRRLFRLYERWTIPGLALHQALRKRHIERLVRAGLAEGFDQVVVLGGGLDTLALRLHQEFPAVRFLELDHPATQRPKREVIERHGLAGANLVLVPTDFARQSLQEILALASGQLPARKTVFVCEGVLMYLGAEEVDRLFDALRRQEAPGVRFLFTSMEPDRRGRPAFRNSTWVVRVWLDWRHEPFRWGLPRTEMAAFVAARGFSLREMVTTETYRQRDLSEDRPRSEVLAEGEILCACDRT
jgi:methyltransferase (TIGR00027 family)